MAYSWIKTHKQGSLIDLHIIPGSKKSEIAGEYNGRLKIKIKAQAEDGKANAELREFLGKFLGIAKSQVEILKGESSKQKVILLSLSPEELSDQFKAYWQHQS